LEETPAEKMFSWLRRISSSNRQGSGTNNSCYDTLIALSSLDDEELALQLAGGAHDALAVLFERYSDLVFRIARKKLRDVGEAEDTVQQVFLDVFRAIGNFDPKKGSFKVWLLQFAYHRSINRHDHLQSRQFYQWVDLETSILPTKLFAGSDLLKLSSHEIAKLVEQLLDTLPPRQQKVMELTFWGGLTAKEIAEQTGESASVVRHLLYRGLNKLRIALYRTREIQNQLVTDRNRECEDVVRAEPRTF
jgi:RNA polymerase sigma-70 factor, ECF subfamily